MIAILALIPAVGQATIVVPMTVETMATKSALVVRAQVLDSTCEWDRSNKHIFTYTRLKVIEALRGKASAGKLIRVRTLGGEIGDVGMAVAGTTKFEPGEEVVIFVRVDPYDSADFQVVGMSQGKFVVKKNAKGDSVVVPNVNGLEFARRDIRGAMKITGQAAENNHGLLLNDLRKRVSPSTATPAPQLRKSLKPVPGELNR